EGDMGVHRAPPLWRTAGVQRGGGRYPERVRMTRIERRHTGDPHGITFEVGGKTGHPFGFSSGARLPEPVQLRGGVQLEAESTGKPRRRVSPDEERQYHCGDPTVGDHSRAGAGPITTPHGTLPTGTVAITAS